MFTLQLAIKAILLNKVRSFLTMLGVIIGVFSVVLLSAIGTGLSAYVTEQFEELGSNNILIFPVQVINDDGSFGGSEQAASSISGSKLRLSDVRNIQKFEFVKQSSPFNIRNEKVTYRSTEERVTIMGTTANYNKVFNTDIEKGAFFIESDGSGNKRVAVLGYGIAETLFGAIDPVGKKIKVGNLDFKIVGVAKEKGASFGGPSFDGYIYIPIETFFKIYDTEEIVRIIVQIKDKDQLQYAIDQIDILLAERLDDDEYDVIDQSEILSAINGILGVLTIGVSGIAAISLFVGGIGIMNIMLVSVRERTREIGLRKALGATPTLIMWQFLLEAALLSLIGGAIGLLLAFIGSLLIQPYFPAKVTVDAMLLAFGVSTAVGLVFGAAPARRAAQLSPIEALRYE